MTKQINDSMASIENNAPAMAQQVRMKSSIESKVAHNEVKRLYVEFTEKNRLFLHTSGDFPYVVRENGYWWCVIQGDPNAWLKRLSEYEDEDDEYQVLIPFANPESWRNDVAELHPSVDKGRTSLYKVFITRNYNMDGRVTYIPSYVFVETMEQDLSTPESNQLADVSDGLPF